MFPPRLFLCLCFIIMYMHIFLNIKLFFSYGIYHFTHFESEATEAHRYLIIWQNTQVMNVGTNISTKKLDSREYNLISVFYVNKSIYLW